VRIISDFNDYYDSVRKSQPFEDNEVLWNRKTKLITDRDTVTRCMELLNVELDRSPYTPFAPSSKITIRNDYVISDRRGIDNSCIAALIAVAGKVYPMIEVSIKTYDSSNGWLEKTIPFLTFEKFDEFKKDKSKKFVSFYKDDKYPQWFFSNQHYIPNDDAWTLLNTPLFIIRPKHHDWREKKFEIECNPCLDNVGFASILDPFTMWQECSMFLNNQLVTEHDPSIVPEQYRYVQRGFDARWSFRKKSLDKK
jgi:hypothetical protein